jgi:hypothetical protein
MNPPQFLYSHEIEALLKPWFDGVAQMDTNLAQNLLPTIDRMAVTRKPPPVKPAPARWVQRIRNPMYRCHMCLQLFTHSRDEYGDLYTHWAVCVKCPHVVNACWSCSDHGDEELCAWHHD